MGERGIVLSSPSVILKPQISVIAPYVSPKETSKGKYLIGDIFPLSTIKMPPELNFSLSIPAPSQEITNAFLKPESAYDVLA